MLFSACFFIMMYRRSISQPAKLYQNQGEKNLGSLEKVLGFYYKDLF